MPFSLAAFSNSHASTALIITNAVADQHLTVVSGRLVVPRALPDIIGAYANGADLARAQLSAPSTRAFLNPELSPVDTNALPASPDRFIDYRFTPIKLQPDEQLELDEANAAAAANICRGAVWLAEGPVTPVAGEVRSERFTAAITGVAETWANGPITLADALPAGQYQIVGARVFGTTLTFFRFVFPGYQWRPGGLGFANATLVEPPEQRFGNLGVWGEFQHNAPPTLDVFCTAADAAQTGVIDLIKVA